MAIIKNTLWSPLTIELNRGKVLTLDSRGTMEISDDDFISEGCQKAFREEKIMILTEEYPFRF
jgi:hypothetical protein